MAWKCNIQGHELTVSKEADDVYELYIDGNLRDKFDGESYRRKWKTILNASIVFEDGTNAVVEFQSKTGWWRTYGRFLLAGALVATWH